MKIRSLLIAATAISALAGTALAQPSQQVQANASFVNAAAVTAGTNLDFGTFTVPTGAGSTISITAGDVRSVSGTGGVAMVGAASSGAPATFTLGAATSTDVNLTLTTANANSFVLTEGNVVGDSGCTGAQEGVFQLSSATCIISVGASATVPAGVTAGTVNVGSITATLSYQ